MNPTENTKQYMLERDGEYIIFVEDDADNEVMWILPNGSLEHRAITKKKARDTWNCRVSFGWKRYQKEYANNEF